MKIYHLTSDVFGGYVEYRFSGNGMLIKMDIKADVSEHQQRFLLQNVPQCVADLMQFKNETTRVTEIVTEVTFEMFWKRYDDKINSSRKRTEKKWNRMTPADRGMAYLHIPVYFRAIPPGTRKKYAETYLNDELWNN